MQGAAEITEMMAAAIETRKTNMEAAGPEKKERSRSPTLTEASDPWKLGSTPKKESRDRKQEKAKQEKAEKKARRQDRRSSSGDGRRRSIGP